MWHVNNVKVVYTTLFFCFKLLACIKKSLKSGGLQNFYKVGFCFCSDI